MYKTKRSPRKSNASSRSGTSSGRFNKANGHKKTSQNGSQPSRRRSSGFAKSESRSEGNRSARRRSRGASSYGQKPRYSKSSGRGNKVIDIAHIVRQSANLPKPKEHVIKNKFTDFSFIPELHKNLETIEFITPTPIQDQSIHHIMAGRDLVGLANTGTGKTGAFLLPIIDKIARDRAQKALIITPTRELAVQIDAEFRKFSQGLRISSTVCIGGVSMFRQLNSLKHKPNIIIGTPGRLKDLHDRGSLRFNNFNTMVLDEVDRMLDMGFIDIIKNIIKQIPTERQSLFFSATIPPVISKLVQQFLTDPVTIEISEGKATHNVEQDIIRVGDKTMKFEQLKEVLTQPDFEKVLIFSETKRGVEKLSQSLYRFGFKVDSIHGDKRQVQRQKSLSRFRNNLINILVATDVAARGLDIKDITHVINYTIPQTYDDYVHRIGRTGRGTNKGIALTFV